MLGSIILYTLGVGVIGTGLGGVIGALFRKDSNRLTSLLLSFSGGIMLSIVCFDLILSSISNSNVYITAIFVAIGVIVIYLLNYFIDNYTKKRNSHLDDNHPKTHDDLDELIHSTSLTDESQEANPKRKDLLKAGIIMVLAIALHNFPEGLSIGSSFAHSDETGFMLAILIALHNIPEGTAIAVPLIAGGMKKPKAVLLTALSGAPTILGAIIGWLIGDMGSMGLAISLSLASGAMIYVVFGEILPQSILMYRSKAPAFAAIAGILLGLLLIYSL